MCYIEGTVHTLRSPSYPKREGGKFIDDYLNLERVDFFEPIYRALIRGKVNRDI